MLNLLTRPMALSSFRVYIFPVRGASNESLHLALAAIMMTTPDATATSEAEASTTLPEQIDSSLRIEDSGAGLDAVGRIKLLFNQTMRVSIRDGRVFLGTFAGTDKLLNILLLNTDEYRFSPPQHANPQGRFVGLVLIPWKLVMRVEAHAPHKAQQVNVDSGVGLEGILETYEDAEDGLYT